MLALTRYPNESVTIETPAGQRIVSVRGQKVKLGFAADADVEVDRAEVRRDKDRRRGVAHAVTVAGAQR